MAVSTHWEFHFENLHFLINTFIYLYIVGQAFSGAYFGSGTGPIFLDDVHCNSSVTRLLQCTSNPIASHNCAHSDDAGVRCEGQ